MSINNADALDMIQRELSGREWSSDTLDAIADIMRAAGYEIADVSDDEGDES